MRSAARCSSGEESVAGPDGVIRFLDSPLELSDDTAWSAARGLNVPGMPDAEYRMQFGPDILAQPADPRPLDARYASLFVGQFQGALSDVKEFYSPQNMTWLAGGLGVAAVMANTGFDEQIVREAYLENIVLAPSDELYEKLHEPRFLGDGYYTIPVFALAALAEPLIVDLPLGEEVASWGQRSLRTILVGGPPVLGLQVLTGGGRPGETNESSEWRPFQDNNGVSGHAFMGAIPFLSAAQLTDNPWLKGSLYVASTLPAISRVNDDAHYFSQALLGWWIAYLAECAVDRSMDGRERRTWRIYPSEQGLGLTFAAQW